MKARMTGRGPQKLWNNYRDFSAQRGEVVADILEKHLPLAGAALLDAGCGSGAIAAALARRGARVIAVDIACEMPSDETIHWRRQAIESLELNGVCDAVILWDVLEHLGDPVAGVIALARALKPGGLLLLATPNRLSWINVLGDPHYGLPLVALLRRARVRRIVAAWLKWHRPDKPDFPELLSLSRIAQILAPAGFDWRFIHRQVYDAAMQNPHGVWNRNWHLHLMNWIKKHKLDRLLRRMVSDRGGFITRPALRPDIMPRGGIEPPWSGACPLWRTSNRPIAATSPVPSATPAPASADAPGGSCLWRCTGTLSQPTPAT